MTAVPFDTLKLADRLQAGGFNAEQARTFSPALADAASSADIATKQDVSALKQDLSAVETSVKRDLSALETSVKRDLSALETSVKRDLVDLEQRVTIRFGGMLVVAVGIILTAIRYLPPH